MNCMFLSAAKCILLLLWALMPCLEVRADINEWDRMTQVEISGYCYPIFTKLEGDTKIVAFSREGRCKVLSVQGDALIETAKREYAFGEPLLGIGIPRALLEASESGILMGFRLSNGGGGGGLRSGLGGRRRGLPTLLVATNLQACKWEQVSKEGYDAMAGA